VLVSMDFAGVSDRLAAIVRRRVKNGECTERGLAARCGLSQPHLSNWLKGRKKLAPSGCDVVVAVLGLDPAGLLRAPVAAPSDAVEHLGRVVSRAGTMGDRVVPITRRPWRRRVDPVPMPRAA